MTRVWFLVKTGISLFYYFPSGFGAITDLCPISSRVMHPWHIVLLLSSPVLSLLLLHKTELPMLSWLHILLTCVFALWNASLITLSPHCISTHLTTWKHLNRFLWHLILESLATICMNMHLHFCVHLAHRLLNSQQNKQSVEQILCSRWSTFLYILRFLRLLNAREKMCLKSCVICTFPNLLLSVFI